MPRFFVENAGDREISVTGADARHIGQSLRMKTGETLTVCDGAGTDYTCRIRSITPDEVLLEVLEKSATDSEPDIHVTLYQGYPKGDKLETVIEKSVELGVYSIVPVLTERSVARPDPKSAAKKLERWQRHAAEAAKQCGRGIIPKVSELVNFNSIEERIKRHQLSLFFYEAGGKPLRGLLANARPETVYNTGIISERQEHIIPRDSQENKPYDIGIFIGPEGGIALPEAESLERWGAVPVTLGRRILRTETAPIAALAALMLLTGNLE